MRFLKITALLFIFHSFNKINAQDFIVGIKYGHGSGTYKRMENSQHTASTYINQYGLNLAFSPYYSKFSVESSIEYEKNNLADYLYIPLGFRITVGKKLRPYIECGGYYSFLLNSHSEEFLMKNDYGARLGIGLLYAVDRRWRIEAGYYRQFGFGDPLVEKVQIPVNSYVSEKNRFSAYNLELVLKFRF